MIVVLKKADFSNNNIGKIQIEEITDSNALSIRNSYYPNMSDAVFKHLNRFISKIKSLYASWDDIKALCLPIISSNVNEAKINVVTGNTIFGENSGYKFHAETKQLYLGHYVKYNFNLFDTGLSSDDFAFAFARQEGKISDNQYELFNVGTSENFTFGSLNLEFPSHYVCSGIGGYAETDSNKVLFSKPCVVSLLNKERNIVATSPENTQYLKTSTYTFSVQNITFRSDAQSTPGNAYKGYQVILISKGLTREKCELLKGYMDEFVNALMV